MMNLRRRALHGVWNRGRAPVWFRYAPRPIYVIVVAPTLVVALGRTTNPIRTLWKERIQ